MTISPFGWQDGSTGGTAITAARLEAMHAAGGAYADKLAPGVYNVRDGSYAGNIASAVADANTAGGGVVYLPTPRGGIHYQLPAGQTLAPGVSIVGDWGADPINTPGTWIDVTDAVNPAFTLKSGCKAQGLSFYYPNQSWTGSAPAIAYPATIKADAGAISRRVVIRDIFLKNAYNGLDLTAQHESYTVENVNGYCINVGLDLDFMTAIDRITGVDFNPNAWDITVPFPRNYPTYDLWTWTNGIGFRVNRADNPIFTNCFAFGYSEGLHADTNVNGAPGRAQWIGGGFDGCKRAANMIAGAQWEFNGTSFNAYNWNPTQFGSTSALDAVRIAHMDGIQFTGCVFYNTQQQALHTAGVASMLLNGCSFQAWGTNGGGAHALPAVYLFPDTASPRRCFYEITGCLFQPSESTQSSSALDGIQIDSSATTAFCSNITGNTFDDIGGAAVNVLTGADNYIVANNVFSRCASHILRTGTPTNAVEGPNLVLA